MTKNKTKNFRQQLRDALANAYWEIFQVETEPDWFAQEHWIIKSEREAYGTQLVISFMNEWGADGSMPMLDNISAFAEKPVRKNIHTDTRVAHLNMSRGLFIDNLRAFIEQLNTYRNNKHTPL